MKIKVSETTPRQLDWLVATIEGFTNLRKNPHRFNDSLIMTPPREAYGPVHLADYSYSTNWAQGGPIIEREEIWWSPNDDAVSEQDIWWCLSTHDPVTREEQGLMEQVEGLGPTLLIAAMRCYVASKLGDEVEIPEELK